MKKRHVKLFKFPKWLFLFSVSLIVDVTVTRIKAQVSPLCVAQTPTEAIQNGGFEDGLGAPATFGPHQLFIGGPGLYSGSGQYYIGKSPKYFNIGFPNDFPPHSGDNMLMVDAAVTANSICWQQTVTIIPNRLYFFSAWIRSLSSGERCQLQFQISVDGGTSWQSLGQPQLAPLPDDPWLQIYESWHSGNQTTAILRLSDYNPSGYGNGGNDFAIDDISFKDLCLDPTLGSKPVMPASISICGKPSIEIPTQVPDLPDTKFTWYKDGVLINSSDVPTLTGVTSPGTYTVCVDSNTCLQSGTITIVNTLSIDLGPDANLCNPAAKVLNTGIDPAVASNFDIKWFKDGVQQSAYDGMPSITADAGGTYRVDVVDKNPTGCNASDEIKITSSLPVPNHVTFCGPNQTVTLSVTGTSTYRWYNAPTGGLSLHTGNTYTVTPPLTGATYYVVDASNITCQRVAVMAKVAPNCCYALTGSTLTSSNTSDICAGTLFNLTYSGGQAGDSLMLQSEDPITGTWNNVKSVKLSDPANFNDLSIFETTNFRVVTFSNGIFGDPSGCQNNSSSITINLAPSPVAGTATISQTAICEGESFLLTLSGSTGNIQWERSVNGGAFTNISGATGASYTESPAANLSPVRYRAVVSKAVCPNVTSNEVVGTIGIAKKGLSLTPSVTGDVCSGVLFNITYSGGQAGDSLMLQSKVGAGSWTNVKAVKLSDPFTFTGISISNTTDFRVVTFSNGTFATAHCIEYSSVLTVNLAVSPVAGTATISPALICKGESVSLKLTGYAGTIQWQRSHGNGNFENMAGATTADYVDYPSQSPVQYKASVRGTSCPNVTSNVVNAVVSEVNSGTITGNSETCDGKPVTLSLNAALGAIQWQDSSNGIWTNIPGQTATSIIFYPFDTVSTNYIRAFVTDPTGKCSAVISNPFTVVSDTCPSVSPIYLPNALTPNGDGNNDVFYIGNIELYPHNHLTIFNRWGSIVFESKGYENTWDGEDLPVATYYYVLQLGEDINGNKNNKNTYKGSVTIIR